LAGRSGDNHRDSNLLNFSGVIVGLYILLARGFYEKSGYRVVGQLDDYSHGQSYYWMRKDF